jgi:amino acid transporter
LHRKLNSFGVLLLTMSCLSPVFSIYGVGSDVLQHAGTGAAVLFLIGIAVAVIWATVYAELGSAFPYAGGDYVGVGTVLGPAAGFVSLALWAVTVIPITAFLAKVVAVYVADLATGVPPQAVIFGSLAAALAVALLAVRTSALVTGLFLAIEMLAVLALIVAGMWHPARSLVNVIAHPMALNAAGTLGPATIGALALGGVSAAFATTGGNQAIAFGEELADPHRRMGRVILIAGLIGAFATAVPIIAVVLGASDLVATFASPAPFSAFMSSMAGPAAARALSAGVALAVFNALIAQVMFSGRLFFSLGRDEIFHVRMNRMMASVHGPSGAPRAATLLVGALSALCCLLNTHLLVVFTSALVVYSLGLVSLAVLVGRAKGSTGQPGYWRSPLYPLAPILGLCLAAVFGVADLLDPDDGRPSILILGSVLCSALAWYHLVLKRRAGDGRHDWQVWAARRRHTVLGLTEISYAKVPAQCQLLDCLSLHFF